MLEHLAPMQLLPLTTVLACTVVEVSLCPLYMPLRLTFTR